MQNFYDIQAKQTELIIIYVKLNNSTTKLYLLENVKFARLIFLYKYASKYWTTRVPTLLRFLTVLIEENSKSLILNFIKTSLISSFPNFIEVSFQSCLSIKLLFYCKARKLGVRFCELPLFWNERHFCTNSKILNGNSGEENVKLKLVILAILYKFVASKTIRQKYLPSLMTIKFPKSKIY